MYAEIDGKQYPINTDFRVGLACFEAINDDITDEERTLAVLGLLFDDDIPNYKEALRIASVFLQCGKLKEDYEKEPLDIDFDYDKDLITASFMSDYHIDLSSIEYMHWWHYCSLITGLKPDAILNRVRDIRNTDLSEVKDPKEKSKVAKAKKKLAIPTKLSKEEEEAENKFFSQLKQ
jgi:hypothetical protein